MSLPGFQAPKGPSRAWRACENCRKKKRKCSGIVPCNHCASRGLPCIYPIANDNAAQSRQYAVNLGVQYDRLDSLCNRMEQMMTRLSTAVNVLEEPPEGTSDLSPPPLESRAASPSISEDEGSAVQQDQTAFSQTDFEDNTHCRNLAELGNLIPDAGNIIQSYIGGISNTLSVNLFQSCRTQQTPDNFDLASPSCSTSSLYGVNPTRSLNLTGPQHCKVPPRYMSDVLVNLFLSRLNPMFPILHEASFVLRYKEHLSRSVTDQGPSPFRSVLLAVYACASNMLAVPRQNQGNHGGSEYFELALLDHYQTLGYDGIEQVQCLTILATFSASCNRLTEAWKLTGQAVRAAQDLGLHVDYPVNDLDPSRPRVWWCVYTLNSCLSTCLGRPTGITDTEHDCRLPKIEQETPVRAGSGSSPGDEVTMGESPSLAGFVALAQACRILDTINGSSQELINELEHRCTGRDNKVVALETQLSEWVREKVPPSVKYAANEPEESNGINLAMCVLTFMIHAIAVINLNLPLIEAWDIDATMFETQDVGSGGSVCKVITAARGIIRGSELILSNIPPSHYLAFCVHLLYLSGCVLLKAFQISHEMKAAEEVQLCVTRLGQLNAVYPGAMQRSEALQWLLDSVHRN